MGPQSRLTEKECPDRGKEWKRTTLRKARFDRGLTLEQAAEKMGITLGYLNTLELGRRDPSLKVALRIAHFYNLSITELWLE